MSRWYAAANKRLDCRTWKKGIAAAEMKDLATVGLPQTCRLAPKVLGEWGPATSSFGLIAPNTSCDGMSTNGRLPFISAKTALSAEKRCADTDTRSQPRSWVNASITSFWDFSSQRTTNDGDFRTNQKFVDISYVVLMLRSVQRNHLLRRLLVRQLVLYIHLIRVNEIESTWIVLKSYSLNWTQLRG